jgi:hypothetical protein
MGKVLINRFDGGLALGERPQTINEQSASQGYNIFVDPFKLKKIDNLTVNETASGASVTSGECPVFDATKRASDGRIIGVGQTTGSGSTTFRFYRKDSSITGNWVQNSSAGSSITNYNAYAVLYKDVQYGYYTQSSESRLYRYDSDSAMTLIGTTADFHSSITPRPVVHSQDNILYMATNKTVSKYDGTTFTASALTLPYYISSMCEYGTYLAIACQAPEGGVIYLWGRDTSLTTLQDVIKVDNGKLQIIENLDGYLVAITETPYDPNTSSISIASTYKTITARMYVGGTMKKIKQTFIGISEAGSNQLLQNKKAIRDGTLIFSTGSNYLMRFGLNQDGQYVLSRDAEAVGQGKTLVTQYGFFILGDFLFSCFRASSGSPSEGLLYRNNSTLNTGVGEYIDTAYYTTTINPSMPIVDRLKDKELQKVAIVIYTGSTSTGSVTVKYSVDNGSNYSTLISKSGSFNSNYIRLEATQDSSGDPFKSGIEFLFKIETTYQIDILQFYYEYENMDSLIEG